MEQLLACRHISKHYHDGENNTQVLNDVSFSVSPGEQVAILGSSGSGKSTLLHILGGLDKPSQGEVEFQGQSLFGMKASELSRLRNRHMGFIYQFHHLLAEFSALENVAMPLLIGGMKESEAITQAKSMLEHVGLQHRLSHKPSELSGGERQRVAIARALVTRPSVVLADEPTGNLDHKTGLQVYNLLKSLSEQLNTSFVVVTHDNALADKMDRVLTLQDGQLSLVREGSELS
ncbi:lipoprotein-releasing ABC transporter ATP-binding protein LolD [Alteromonas aestuariivivens]|uniref:Lipoprotein-releasing system ATP-binding protein LolD n=1 Tax=Alteromonas aestuariivivens TaxID=1938339 RepID=A0A3D8MBJ5_9ALTE|nr:lipoprotein-releasing ABC transporter ATP-binding protein LolD [Alteromonas aestuariivivens]RDV27445.1 lipoprotein-releasing ABC transporter ATP-binding protein LolD [Alteromonas aestuariivivens]